MADDLLLDPSADDQKLLALVLDYYRQTLTKTPEALEYLRSQGITDSEAIERFRLGYADRTLGLKLPSMKVKAGKLIRTRLQRLGLYRDSGHEHFAGCVVFPVLAADGTGRIVDVYGRKMLGNRLRKGTALDLYLNDERKGVWNVEALTVSDEVILCPSIFDALSFWCLGYRNVICTFGPDALTSDHLSAFQEFKVRRVLVVAEVLVPKLIEAGLDCYLVKLQDVHSYATANGAEALGDLLRNAEWMGNGQPQLPTTVPVVIAPAPATAVEEPPQPLIESIPIQEASPLPPSPECIDAELKDDEAVLTFGDRRYRTRGWSKNLSFDQLKVNVLVTNEHGLFVDTFDLYAAKHRKAFVEQAADELGADKQTIKKDLGRVLLKLEELQDHNIQDKLMPKDPTPQMTDDEKAEAMRLLKDPHLLDRILADFDLVGEPVNKLAGYLAAVSRKLDEPLAVVVQSSSAAGKTALMDAVLALVPPEDLVKFSAVTGQSLFYMGEDGLKHKVLAIVEEEGAERASYALKLLQSEGELTIASTGKDASNGRLVTQQYRVEGPVMLFLTTTAISIDEELLNRCLVLTVNEGREQTRAIHQAQRRRHTLQGLLARQQRQQVLALHRNAQRLLRPLLVANPYAESLTFADARTRTRRDHQKYLTLIRAVALLHQHQRTTKTIEHDGKNVEYIEVTPQDIEIANNLAHEVLGRCLDELPPQTRRLLELIIDMVTTICQQNGIDRADYRFSRRDVREHTGWGHSQLAIHLRRLEELEYLLVHRGRRGRSFEYELVYEKPAQGNESSLSGLIDPMHLRRNLPGFASELPDKIRVTSGPNPGHFRATKLDATPDADSAQPLSEDKVVENAHLDTTFFETSYRENHHAP